MDNSTANLIMLGSAVLILIYFIFIRPHFVSKEKLDREDYEYDKEKSNAIKRGIRNSKLYGTKKQRREWNNRY